MTRKILVIDDDPFAQRLATLALQSEGFEVVAARGGQEGLEMVRKEQPSLVILDIILPDMDGYEVCRRLRRDPASARLPILMLTAKTQVVDKVTGLQVGSDDYIPKPAAPQEIVTRVKALLARAGSSGPGLGRCIGFLGAKGGMGTTTVAVNVGVTLAGMGHKTVLLELRPGLGIAARLLRLTPRSSLANLLDIPEGDLTSATLEACLTRHPSGLRVLASPAAGLECRRPTVRQVRAICMAGQALMDYVLVDLAPLPDETTMATLPCCDFVALVVDTDPLTLACAQETLHLMSMIDLRGDSVAALVVERVEPATHLSLAEVNTQVPTGYLGLVPVEPETFHEAARRGVPVRLLSPTGAAALAFAALAERLSAPSITPEHIWPDMPWAQDSPY